MYQFKKLYKKVLTSVLAVSLCAVCFMPLQVKAYDHWYDGHRPVQYTKEAGPWQVTETITASIKDGCLYIDGTGALPDYTNDTLNDRPWHTSIIGGVTVGAGITYIGTRAFAEFPYLRNILVHSTTYVSDSSVFHKIDNKPSVRIMGSEEATELVGEKIPYTSLDSWAKIAQSSAYNIMYVMDNGTMKNLFRNKTYPVIPGVFSADNADIERRSTLQEEEYKNLPAYVSPGKFAPGYEMPGRAVTTKIVKQSKEYLSLVAYYLNNVYPEYSYGQSYSNTLSTGDTVYKELDTTRNYQLQIPAELKSPGRTFKVIQVVDGQPAVLDDLDVSDDTVTFATDKGVFSFSIIYTG